VSWQDKLFDDKPSPYLALGRLGNSHPWVWIIGGALIWFGGELLTASSLAVFDKLGLLVLFYPESIATDRAQISGKVSFIPYILALPLISGLLLCLVQIFFRERPLKDLITSERRVRYTKIGVGFVVFLAAFFIGVLLTLAIGQNYPDFAKSLPLNFAGPVTIALDVGLFWSIIILLILILDTVVFTLFLRGFIFQALATLDLSKFKILVFAVLVSLSLNLILTYSYYFGALSAMLELIAFTIMISFISILGKGLEYAIGVGIACNILVGYPHIFGTSFAPDHYASNIPLILVYLMTAAFIWKLCDSIKHGDNIEDIYD